VEPVSRLGRPLGEQVDRYYAGQAFQHGFMFWRDNAAAALDWIYVIQWGPGDDPTAGLFWARFDDTWTDDSPEYFCDQTAPPYGPRRGFGKVWCQRTEVRHALGGAIEREWGEHGGWQDFEQGVKLWDAENDRTFVLYEDGTWEAVSE
jgi:hypothetical protein